MLVMKEKIMLEFRLIIHLYVWARSSSVERFSDKEEVDGSIPSVPTFRLGPLIYPERSRV